MLDSVADGAGNAVSLSQKSSNPKASLQSNTVRSLTALRPASVSFKRCDSGHPAGLLINGETDLIIVPGQADPLDGPWDVTVNYQPPTTNHTHETQKLRPWKQKYRLEKEKRELALTAKAPGEYTIVDVRGQHCAGEVLNPDTCKVIQQAKPAADINWDSIHEW